MASYSAGDLQVSISAMGQGATKSIEDAIKALSSFDVQLKNTLNLLNNKKKTANPLSTILGGSRGEKISSFKSFFNYTRAFIVARKLGQVVARIAQDGADYTETLNLWETAMGDNLNSATEFVNKMNEAYGISEKTLMNAQAIFKNMLGSLGQITDQMAYQLSEGITQMAVDYASLYNVTFDQAFTKFQSALAGQVRPIRSVSGYDITENTIYQLYKELGGTKSVRNLNRTEKQLLGLLAIFDQMEASGALGDLAKTMDSYANQARVMAEAWAQIKSYSGAIITNFLQTSGIMETINGFLLFLGDLLKAVAESTNAIQHFGGSDPFAGVEQGATDASDAIDEVTGKLLDFDKFRSMSSSEDNGIGLDQKLLDALSGYNSTLENMSLSARNFANNLKEASGLFNDDGTLDVDKWQEVVDAFESLGIALGFLISAKMITGILDWVEALKKAEKVTRVLNGVILTGLVWSISQLIQAFERGDVGAIALYFIISGWLIGAFVALNKKAIMSAYIGLGKFLVKMVMVNTFARGSMLKGIIGLSAGFIGLGASIAGAFLIIQNWDDMSLWQRIIGIIGVATTAILGLALAFGAFHSAWSLGLATAGIVAGIGMIVASIATVKKGVEVPVEYHAMGASNLEGGSLFIAGEHGKTEMVYSGSNGQGNVANIQQIKQAQAQALSEWWSSARNDIPAFREVSKTGIYEVVKSERRRRGE